MLEIRLLGQFDLRRDGLTLALPSRSAQSLLAYLLLNPGISHRREQLAGLLSPDADETSARNALRHALWRIRKTLGVDPLSGRDYLIADDIAISFDPLAARWLDAAVVAERMPAAPERTRGEGEPTDQSEALLAALRAYGGDLLPGFYDDWVVLERERLEAAFEGKMRLYLEIQAAAGKWGDVLEWAERWISLGHSPETAYVALMLAHAAAGDSSRVAAAYQRCVEDLRNGLGVAPGEATRRLYEQLVKGEKAGPVELVALALAIPGTGPGGTAVSHPAVPGETVQEAGLRSTGEALAKPAPPAPGPPPFRGLQPFQTGDARLFFGREALTRRLVEHVQHNDLLFVVGASGSGKSSLLRAGLIPALQRGALVAGNGRPLQDTAHWTYRVMTPTGHPLQALALAVAGADSVLPAGQSVLPAAQLADDMAADPRALALHLARWSTGGSSVGEEDGPRHLLLVADQFEELFALCPWEEERTAFIANLMAAVPPEPGSCGGPLTLAIGLRADFYSACARYPALRQALEHCQHYIGAMDSSEIRRCIEGPLAAGGWEAEPGLVDLLVRDAGAEPGALPLLSHALLETWRGRSGRVLTLGAYAATGGVRGAIARTADSVFAQFDAEEQAAARRIFLRLTALGDDTQETRRRVAQGDLVSGPETEPLVESVLETLAAARLITVANDQVEMAHEALIREWPLFRRWLADDREGLRLHHRLAQAVEIWEASQDPADLYRGGRLVQALEWAARHPDELNPDERAFLAASQSEANREAEERESQRQRELAAAQERAHAERARAEEQRRIARQLRRRAVLLAVVALAAVALAGLAVVFGRQARQTAAVAAQQRTLAFTRELIAAAGAQAEADPALSTLLALKAVDIASAAGLPAPADADGVLRRALQASQLDALVLPSSGAKGPVAISPEALLAATNEGDGRLSVWDLAVAALPSREGLAPRHSLPVDAALVEFSRDGRVLAAADRAGRISLVEAQTGAVQRVLDGHAGGVSMLRFSADGSRLLSGGADNMLRTWEVASGKELKPFAASADMLGQADISPDGKQVLANLGPGVTHLCDPTTGLCSLRVPPQGGGPLAPRFCGQRSNTGGESGARFAVAAYDSLQLWDAKTGAVQWTAPAPEPSLIAMACSPDGRWLATSSWDGKVRVWDAETGESRLALSAGNDVSRIEYTADGGRLVVTYRHWSSALWNLEQGRELAGLTLPYETSDIAFSPDGALILAAGGAEPIAPPGVTGQPEPSILAGWLTGNEAMVPVASLNRNAGFWQLRFQIVGNDRSFKRLAISPVGEQVATGSAGGAVRIWRGLREAGAPIEERQWTGDGSSIVDLAFDKAGQRVAIASGAAVRIWDLAGHGDPELLSALPNAFQGAEPLALAWVPEIWAPAGRAQALPALALGLSDGSARFVDASTGARLVLLQPHTGAINALAFSPDGKQFATASADGTVALWDTAAVRDGAQPKERLRGHEGAINALAWRPDGRALVTAGQDGSVRLWPMDGEPDQPGAGPTLLARSNSPVTGVAFSPDGRLVATSGDTVRVHLARLTDLVDLARRRVSRSLTGEERQQYLHEAAETVQEQVEPVASPKAPRILALVTPVHEGKAVVAEPGPRELVDQVISLWRGNSDSSTWPTLLMPANVEFQMGPNFFTNKYSIPWYLSYWAATHDHLRLVGCDPSNGRTIRCQLEWESDCEQLVGVGPWHLDTTVTVSQGRIEKFLAKASPEEVARWTAALEDLWTWATENRPEAFAKYVSVMDEASPDPELAGRAIRQLCEAYAKR